MTLRRRRRVRDDISDDTSRTCERFGLFLRVRRSSLFFFFLSLLTIHLNDGDSAPQYRSPYIERTHLPRIIRNDVVCRDHRLDYPTGSLTFLTVRIEKEEEKKKKERPLTRSCNSSYVAHRKCFELSTDFSNFISRALSLSRPVFFLSPPSEPPAFGASTRITPEYMSPQGPIEFLLPSCTQHRPFTYEHSRKISAKFRLALFLCRTHGRFVQLTSGLPTGLRPVLFHTAHVTR